MNTQQRQARLTGLEVQEAIRHLQEQGIDNPSIRRIYQALGQRGSFSKIIDLKKQVLSQTLSNGGPTVTPKDNNVIPIDNNISNSAAVLDNILANANPPSVINLAHLEKQLWERIETRLKEWEEKLKSPEPDSISQVSELKTALSEMRDLWLEAITQCQKNEAQVQELKDQLSAPKTEHQTSNEKAPSQLPSTSSPSQPAILKTEVDPLETYFQTLTQLQGMNPAQKYDCAMRLFERGLGPSEASRILGVNKGSLQHYKDGKRKRPREV